MRLTTYSDYALRVLMYLALKSDGLSTIAEIAESYDISQTHLMKVAHQLGVAGYIETVRGRRGGLRLAKPVEAIGLAAVIRTGVARMADLALWMSMLHRARRGAGASAPGEGHPGKHEGWAQRQQATQVLVRAQLRRVLEPDADRFRYPVDVAIVMLEAMLTGAIVQSADRLRQGQSARSTDADLVVDFFLHGALRPVQPTP